MKDFSNWIKYERVAEASGTSEKIWLQNLDTGETGLFKFRKDKTTTDHVSESIAYRLACLLNLKCAKFEVGKYDGKWGSMSYNIIQNDDMILVEGINFINLKYPEYDPEKFCDLESNSYYSIEMIQESLKDYNGIFEKLISILIFDFLIGNSARHQSNWALVNEKERWSLSPMYDNSSSLCAYVSNQQIEQYMGKDKMLWNALVDSKSRSLIRIGVTDKKRPTHLEVMNYLNQRYPDIVRTYERRIKQRITEQNIEKILKDYTDEELSFQRKMLIKKYLLCKKNMFVQLVEGKEEKE